jgi:hypothetical protein
MKLLQTEIDIEPGRQPQPPQREGALGRGAAVLRLTNNSKRENAYTIRIEGGPCPNQRFWQKSWYRITSLPPNPADPNNTPSPGREDQRGNQDQWVKIFVKPEGTRDVQIRFTVPKKPEARAGVYPFKVQIETDIVDAGAGTARKERFTYLPAVAIVRPYYQWKVSLLPDTGRRVGRFRRRAAFEVEISNEGNDWLYCDLNLPRPKDLRLETPVQRAAVRPPEPGEDAASRRIPLTAISQLKTLRGDHMPLSIPLQLIRVDAPSVPPLSVDADFQGVATASLGAAVVATTTGELQQTPGDTVVTYCPPIPSTLTGFVGALTQNIKGLAVAFIGFIVLLHMGVWFWQGLIRRVVAEPITSSVQPGQMLTFKGIQLEGATVVVKHNGTSDIVHMVLFRGNEPKVSNNKVETALAGFNKVDLKYWSIKIDPSWKGQTLTLEVHRLSFLPTLANLLKYECETKVAVEGPPPVQQVAPAKVYPLPNPLTKRAGETTRERGSNLGEAGKVQIDNDNRDVTVVHWTKTEVEYVVPGWLAPGIHNVSIIPEGKAEPQNGTPINIPAATPAGGPTTGGSAPTTGGTGGASPQAGAGSHAGAEGSNASNARSSTTGTTPRTPQSAPTNFIQSFAKTGGDMASKDYQDIARIADKALNGGKRPANFDAISRQIDMDVLNLPPSAPPRTVSILKTALGLRIACGRLFGEASDASWSASFDDAVAKDNQNFLAYLWRARCLAADRPLGGNPDLAATQLNEDMKTVQDPNALSILKPVLMQIAKKALP